LLTTAIIASPVRYARVIASNFPFGKSLAKELSPVLFIKLVAKPIATHHTQAVGSNLNK